MNKRADREERFAHEYVKDLNGTRAAIAAGYAEKSAFVTASRLLRKAKVQERIAELHQRLLDKCDVTAEKGLADIAKLAFANMLDYVTPQSDGTAFVDLSKLTREQAAAIQEISTDEVVEGREENAKTIRRVRFKLSDKRGSLELLGRHLRLFADKVELTGLENLPEILAEARKRANNARHRS